MSRINALATGPESVGETELMSAQHVAKRDGAQPESTIPGTLILQPCRTYRLTTGVTATLPDITEAMDGAKIVVVQLSGSSTISKSTASVTINAASNVNGGVKVVFVARYVAGGTSIWYIETQGDVYAGTFPTITPISPDISKIIATGIIRDNGIAGVTIKHQKGATCSVSKIGTGQYSLSIESTSVYLVAQVFLVCAHNITPDPKGTGTNVPSSIIAKHTTNGSYVGPDMTIPDGGYFQNAASGYIGANVYAWDASGDFMNGDWGYTIYQVG